MIMSNFLGCRDVPSHVMATNSSPASVPEMRDDDEDDPVPGIAHPTVVPTNFESADDE